MSDEEDIKEFVKDYIEVLTTGKTKFVEKNTDLKAMYVKDGEIYGKWALSKKMSENEYEDSFKNNTLRMMKTPFQSTFEMESFEIKDDEATVKVKKSDGKPGQPMILKKIKGNWKLIWIPTWSVSK